MRLSTSRSWMSSGKIDIQYHLLFFLCILGGIFLGYVLIEYSWQVGIIAVLVPVMIFIFLYKPEYGLYLLTFLIIVITQDPPEGTGGFYIHDINLPGFPSGLMTFIMLMFPLYFFRFYFVEARKSIISVKYLWFYSGILLLAAIFGIRGGWEMDRIRDEFMRMLFPVIGFYLCVNILDDRQKILRIIRIVFIACVIKSSIIDFYYLTGRGVPFGGNEDYRIVSSDSAELMVFITMILLVYIMISKEKIRGISLLFSILGTFPMIFAVILSFRRGHWLGMIISVILIFLWGSSEYRKKIILSFLLGLFLLIPTVFLVSAWNSGQSADDDLSRVSKRFSTLFDPEQGSNKHHYFEAVQTFEDIMQSPILGLGLGSEHTPVLPWLVDEWQEEDQPTFVVHNTFLYVWMKLGILGLLFLIWWGIIFIKRIVLYRQICNQNYSWPIILAIASSIGLWLIMFLTGPVPWYFHQTFLIAFFSAVTIALIHLDINELITPRLTLNTSKLQPQ